jgi:hypothetical protein
MDPGEFDLLRSAGALLGSHLTLPTRWRMIYYSCTGSIIVITNQAPFEGVPGYLSGPEGSRTPDLLNAIEARSQLRYRPKILTEFFF